MSCLVGSTECREAWLSPARKWRIFSLISLRLALCSRASGKPTAGPRLLFVKVQLDWDHSGSERLLRGAKAWVVKPPSQPNRLCLHTRGTGPPGGPSQSQVRVHLSAQLLQGLFFPSTSSEFLFLFLQQLIPVMLPSQRCRG